MRVTNLDRKVGSAFRTGLKACKQAQFKSRNRFDLCLFIFHRISVDAVDKQESMTTEVKSEARIAGKYLTFRLGGEFYGISVLKIREIIRMQSITLVPQMPAFIKGVINLRGKIIPVIDLRIKFGMTPQPETERTCIIVVQVALPNRSLLQMGMIVDAVEEVLNIGVTDIEETPDFGARVETYYILGMAKSKGAVKTLLDIDRVVSGQALEEIAQSATSKESPSGATPATN
jgi:purine-binding chemotaxis protein CheW